MYYDHDIMTSEDSNSPSVSDLLSPYIKIINELNLKNVQLLNEVKCLKRKLDDMSTNRSPEKTTTELYVHPNSPVGSISPNIVDDFSSAEIPVHQGIKIRRCEQSSLNSLKSKPQITRKNSSSLGVERSSAVVITSNDIFDEHFRIYDPEERIPRTKPGAENYTIEDKENKKKDIKNLKKKPNSDETSNYLPEITTNEPETLPFPPVASLSSSDMVDLSFSEVPEKQKNKIKRCQVPCERFSPDQFKPQITRSTPSLSVVLKKMSTSDTISDKCLESYESQAKHITSAEPESKVWSVNTNDIASEKSQESYAPEEKHISSAETESISDEISSDTASDNSQESYSPKVKHITSAEPESMVWSVNTSDTASEKSQENYAPKVKNIPSAEPPESISDVIKSNTVSDKYLESYEPQEKDITSAEPDNIIWDVNTNDTASDKFQKSYSPKEKHIPGAGPENMSSVYMNQTASEKSQESFASNEKHISSAEPVCLKRMVKDVPTKILKGDPDYLEIPEFSLKKLMPSNVIEGTEIMTSDMYYKRHSKMENKEIQQSRWEVQRNREMSRIEHLKKGCSTKRCSKKGRSKRGRFQQNSIKIPKNN